MFLGGGGAEEGRDGRGREERNGMVKKDEEQEGEKRRDVEEEKYERYIKRKRSGRERGREGVSRMALRRNEVMRT